PTGILQELIRLLSAVPSPSCYRSSRSGRTTQVVQVFTCVCTLITGESPPRDAARRTGFRPGKWSPAPPAPARRKACVNSYGIFVAPRTAGDYALTAPAPGLGGEGRVSIGLGGRTPAPRIGPRSSLTRER